MRTPKRYGLMIRVIVHYKNEWERVSDQQYDGIKRALASYHYDPSSLESESMLPNNKMLAEALSLNQAKVNKLIIKMYQGLLHSFQERPLEIKESYHVIRIGRGWEDAKGFTKQQSYIEEKEQYIRLKLPFTPRAGDFIDLGYVLDPEKFTNGYVHSVTHTIQGNSQVIYVEVHPHKDYYHRWKAMENKYESDTHRRLNT